jgi:hypothetical protein
MCPPAGSNSCSAVLQVKHKSEYSGRGGDWAVRVQTSRLEEPQQPGEPRPPRRRLSLVFYMAEENAQQEVEVRGGLGADSDTGGARGSV